VNACCRREPRYAAVNFDRYVVGLRRPTECADSCSFRLIFLVTVVMAAIKSCKYIVIPRISATKTLILLRGHSRSYILAPNDTSCMTLYRLYFPSVQTQRYCRFCMPTASFSYPTPVRLFWLKFRDVAFGVDR